MLEGDLKPRSLDRFSRVPRVLEDVDQLEVECDGVRAKLLALGVEAHPSVCLSLGTHPHVTNDAFPLSVRHLILIFIEPRN